MRQVLVFNDLGGLMGQLPGVIHRGRRLFLFLEVCKANFPFNSKVYGGKRDAFRVKWDTFRVNWEGFRASSTYPQLGRRLQWSQFVLFDRV